MRRTVVVTILAVSLGGLATGCFKTQIKTGKTASAVTQTHKQWFALGLLNVSSTAGEDCAHGLADAESSTGGTDLLVHLAGAVVGGVVGAFVCPIDDTSNSDKAVFGACLAGTSSVGAMLVGSRTVEYHCAE